MKRLAHIVSECGKLAQNEYKNFRHDKVAAILHWSLSKQYGFETNEKCYEHFVDKENRVKEKWKKSRYYGISQYKRNEKLITIDRIL